MDKRLEAFVDVTGFGVILNIPDEDFKVTYDTIKENFDEIFAQSAIQSAALQAATTIPGTMEDEKVILEELLKTVDETDYCEEKKDFLRQILTKSYQTGVEMISNPRERVTVSIYKLNPDATIPSYAHPTDAGADVCAVEETKIEAGATTIVKTGIAVAVPAGYEIQVRPRSGLSLKSGLRIANAPGTIDADYRGEVGIIVTNTGDIPYVIDKGMKIAQLVVAPTPMIRWKEVNSLEELGSTERGKGGFGSTDKKS